MTENVMQGDSNPAVRVELFGGDEVDADIAPRPPLASSPNRWPAVAMGLGLCALVGGLWWAASLTSTEERSQDIPPQRPADIQTPAPDVLLGESTSPDIDSSGLDARRRLIDENGQWTPATFSAPSLDGEGFVGLANVDGQVHLLESRDGFTIDRGQTTNFPFGYFTNSLQTTEAGYHVVGHLARIEDAVFTSPDGLEWGRFEIDVPLPATALDIDHFHRSAQSAALVGSLGSAGSFSAPTSVAMWWGSDGVQVIVPDRPCDSSDDCTITSVISVPDGLLVTHERDRSAALSKWSVEDGWTSIARLDPDPLESATLFSTSNDAVWFLGADRIVRSDDGGRNWNLSIETPPGEQGRFIGVSDSGLAAVFQTETDLWLRANGSWSQFPLGDVTVGRLLALTDETAILTGSSPEGSVSIRLVPLET